MPKTTQTTSKTTGKTKTTPLAKTTTPKTPKKTNGHTVAKESVAKEPQGKAIATRPVRMSKVWADYQKDPHFEHLRYHNTFVPGIGSLSAKVFIIGEAPGEQEQREGKPFRGRSGQLLMEMLAASDIKPVDCFITNVLKYRPPQNRDPSPDETAHSMPYILRELEIVQPKVVVPMGRFALSIFMPDAIIGKVHGSAWTITHMGKPFVLVPQYHPAYTLYNQSAKPTAFADFLKVGEYT